VSRLEARLNLGGKYTRFEIRPTRATAWTPVVRRHDQIAAKAALSGLVLLATCSQLGGIPLNCGALRSQWALASPRRLPARHQCQKIHLLWLPRQRAG